MEILTGTVLCVTYIFGFLVSEEIRDFVKDKSFIIGSIYIKSLIGFVIFYKMFDDDIFLALAMAICLIYIFSQNEKKRKERENEKNF